MVAPSRLPMVVVLAFALGFAALADKPGAEKPVDYVRDVKPILAKNCASCHAGKNQRGGLRVDTVKFMLQGGDNGPAIVPGKSSESPLIKAVTRSKGVKPMPPKETLPAEQVAILKAWIDQGAKAPSDETIETKSNHWSFQPVKRPQPPAVKNESWVRNPIDRFILAPLEEQGIRPAPEADRITLIRRLSLDLLGLPPTPGDVDAFLADQRPDAYERLVDKLLASPHYGERQARHWLDLARYADSNGYTIDSARGIWKYRDWVIDAFNRDQPFDAFSIEQMAGDMLPNATTEQKIATGFHRCTQINEEGGIDHEQFRVEAVVDRVNTTGSVFLGLTVGCCQCHDHKFDPLPQREYYQLFAFLNNCEDNNRVTPTLELATPEQIKQRDAVRTRIADLERTFKLLDRIGEAEREKWEMELDDAERAALPKEIAHIVAIALSGRSKKQAQTLVDYVRFLDQARHPAGTLGDPFGLFALTHVKALTLRKTLGKQIAELKKEEPQVTTTLILQERKTPRETRIHIQGDFTRKGAVVKPGTIGVLHPLPKDRPAEALTRLDLAKWLVDPANPLTPRVTMNRLWMHHFGIGIVETENDFGTQGTAPSHPALLDWLASEFVAQKWSMKAMHRLMVTSATYRQSSKARPDLNKVDARNRLLARMPRVRQEAEIVRDVALAASDLLTPQIGGPSVHPPQPEGVFRFTQVPREWKPSTGADRYRRGMYTYFWRSAPHPGLTVFDAPDATVTCTRRNRSNTPLQALTLLNDQAHVEFAQALATRVLKEADSDTDRLKLAFRLCLSRSPNEKELNRLRDFLAQQVASFDDAPEDARYFLPPRISPKVAPKQQAAWTMVARVLLNLDEFITRE